MKSNPTLRIFDSFQKIPLSYVHPSKLAYIASCLKASVLLAKISKKKSRSSSSAPSLVCPFPLSLCSFPLSVCPFPLSVCPFPLSVCPFPLLVCSFPLLVCPFPLLTPITENDCPPPFFFAFLCAFATIGAGSFFQRPEVSCRACEFLLRAKSFLQGLEVSSGS